MRINLKDTELRISILLFLFLVFLPFLLSQNPYFLSVLILSFIFVVLALSWNLMVGYTGILSLGHAGFFGAGAYASALLTLNLGAPVWIGVLFAGGFSTLLGLIVSLPVLRIRGIHYQAIVTLAFSEILHLIVRVWVDLTRGELALWGFPRFPQIEIPLLGTLMLNTKIGAYYLTLILFVCVYLLLFRLVKSKAGLKFMAIRDDEEAAESVGIDSTKYKIGSFLVSSFIAGIAGAFYAHYMGILSPDLLGLEQSTLVIVGVLWGGIGTTFGPIIGVFSAFFASEILRPLLEIRFVIWAILILIVMLFMPRGLIGIVDYLKKHIT